MIRFGICGGAESVSRFENAAAQKLDYAELNICQLRGFSAQERTEVRSRMAGLGLPVEAFNGMFKKERFFGEAATPVQELWDAVRLSAEIASDFGAEVIVLGSGKSRAIPEGMEQARAEDRFLAFLDGCAEILRGSAVKIAIEPLRTAETNFINTFRSCVELTDKLGRPEIGPLVDFFHFWSNGEPLADLAPAEGRLLHAHLARPDTSRGAPKQEDEKILRAWAEELKKTGYDGRLSLECGWSADETLQAQQMRSARNLLSVFA